MKRLAVLLVVLACVACAAQADERSAAATPWYSGYSLEGGASAQQENIQIHDSFEFPAELTNERNFRTRPYFRVNTPDRYFGSSRFGYNVFLSYRKFQFDYQYTEYQGVGNRNLGTSAHGYYSFIVPQVFFDLLRGENTSLKFGAGIGYGRIHAEGTYYPGNWPPNPIRSFSVTGNGFVPGVMLEFRYHVLAARLSLHMPIVKDSAGNEYDVSNTIIDIGYRHVF